MIRLTSCTSSVHLKRYPFANGHIPRVPFVFTFYMVFKSMREYAVAKPKRDIAISSSDSYQPCTIESMLRAYVRSGLSHCWLRNYTYPNSLVKMDWNQLFG